MSKSIKRPIYKDKGHLKSIYWRIIRRHIRQKIKTMEDSTELELPNPKVIINDYDYCDYIFRSVEDKYKRK